MKFILPLFILSFFSGKAASAQKNQLLFTLNPDECSSCINALSNIALLDTGLIQASFVLEEKYLADSDVVVKNLMLERYRLNYIWSDSLYRKLIVNRSASSAAFMNKEGSNARVIPLKGGFTPGAATAFNRMASSADTFVSRERIFPSGLHYFRIQRDRGYFLDGMRNILWITDNVRQQTTTKIVMDESFLRKAFYLKFKNDKAYDTAKIFAENLGLAKANAFINFCVDKDGAVYLSSEHYYFYLKSATDTHGVKFNVLSKFQDGKIQQQYLLDGSLVEEPYLIKPRFFWVDGTTLWIGVSKAQPDGKKDYFAARMELSEDKVQFKSFFDATLAPIYKAYGYNFSSVAFRNGYAALSLNDRFYSLSDPEHYLDPGHFPVEAGDEAKRLGYQMSLSDFRIDKKYLYMIYWNDAKKSVCFYKYDIARKTAVLDVPVSWDESRTAFLQIDDFDFNYVHIPVSDYSWGRRVMR